MRRVGAKRAIINAPRDRVFVFAGESNSAGIAPNTDASGPELAPRSEVKILNVSTFQFENLDIGTNNNLDHLGADSTTHGWENELANAVAARRLNASSVYLVQTGQGGDTIDTWAIGHASGYWTKLAQRIGATKTNLKRKLSFVVFYTQGINDLINYSISTLGTAFLTDTAGWKAATIAHFANLRGVMGSDTIILMTKFGGANTLYNTRMDEIAAADPLTFAVDCTTAPLQGDGNHWTYAGYKETCQRLLDAYFSAMRAATPAPTILPVSGEYGGAQTVIISGIGTIKYSTDGTDPFGAGTIYSGSFTGTPEVTIKARAIEQETKSGLSSVAYTSPPAATAWGDHGANIALSNASLDAAPSAGTFSAVRNANTAVADKSYYEIEVVAGHLSSGEIFIGLMDDATANGSGLDSLTPAHFAGIRDDNYNGAFNGFSIGSTAGYAAADVGARLQIAISKTAKKCFVGMNNTWSDGSNPGAGTGAMITWSASYSNLYAAAVMADSGWHSKIRIIAPADHTYSPPSGFTAE